MSMLSCSRLGSNPCILFSRSMPAPPECAELLLYSEPAADSGSPGFRSISAKFSAEYDEVVETDPP